MNQFEMVAFIVFFATVAILVRTKIQSGDRRATKAENPDTAKMREEIQGLRDRVAVLERIATDKEITLEREIDRLRDS